VVKTTGDGCLAVFDAPRRAMVAADGARTALAALGLEIRAGLHCGEVEFRGADVAGVAVHLAARVMAEASTGEILVTRTVRDLVAGSTVQFTDAGEHQLKGFPEPWSLYLLARL
jgi:class 3 adenylate cyclase